MTVKVLLSVSYMWLTFTTLANGQYYPGAPGNFFTPQSQPPGNPYAQPNGQQNGFSPGRQVPRTQYSQPNGQQNFYPPEGQVPGFGPNPQVINPQNRPNSNTFSPQTFNTPQAMDLSSLLPPGFAPFPMNQPTSLGPQNAAPYNPPFPPQRPPPRSFSYPRQTSPFNNGPQGPSSVFPNQQPRDSFITRPQQTSPYFPQPTSQIINPSNLRHQSPNPVPEQTNPYFPSPQQIPQGPRRPQQTNADSIGPQQSNSVPPTGHQQNNFVPPTVPEQSYPDSTSPQQIPQDPTGPQQTNTDSAGPQQSNSVPPTAPQSTDSGSAVPQQTDSYPAGSQTTNPESDGSQPITSESESSSSVSKAPQDTGSMPSVPQHPSHGPHSHRPPPEKEIHSHPSGDPLGGLRILCIFNNRHFFKNGFTPAQLEPHLCTHLNYEFAILDPKTYEMMIGEPDLDVERRFYEEMRKTVSGLWKGQWPSCENNSYLLAGFSVHYFVLQEAVGLKKVNPHLKVMMSLGGWGDSTKKWSEMAADQSKRHNLTQQAVSFLQRHGFDGLDIAWEYPNCWQGAIGVSPKDKPNFVALLREMKPEFEKNGLLLSVSVGAIKREVDAAYDVPEISKNVDYINVMTYDMHGPWEAKTSHHVQFEPMPDDKDKYCNVKGGIQVWIEKGADPKKLNMGLAFYGRTFKMKEPGKCGMGVTGDGAGDPGPITKEGGILSYHEICDFLNSGNCTEKEDKHAGFYACCGNQFIGYDNPIMMVKKTRFVCDKGLGGVLVKDLSGDDSKGECFNMPFPLLKMVKLEMMHRVRQMNS